MYTRYYDTYPSQSENKDTPKEATQEIAQNEPQIKTASILPFGNSGGFKSDDILLVAILLLILNECKDDNIMPIILGYILLGGGLF